jgi:hypothetical protein
VQCCSASGYSPLSAQLDFDGMCVSYDRFVKYLRQSPAFIDALLASVRRLLPGDTDKINIVSYGIGSFGRTSASMYQLCALCELCARLPTTAGISVHSCVVTDPVFSADERRFIDRCGHIAGRVNDRATSVACSASRTATVYYMPHCGKPMYNNVLWANWHRERLSRIVIIGNTLSNLMNVDAETTELVYIRRAIKCAQCVPLPAFGRWVRARCVRRLYLCRNEQAFNNTSVMAFRCDLFDGNELDDSFWQRDDTEPAYVLTANQMITSRRDMAIT